VRGPRRRRAFYERLGLRFVDEKHGYGPAHYSARVGALVLELYPSSAGPTSAVRLGFNVTDVATACAAVTDVGGRVIRHDRGTAPTALIEDPDGNKIELAQQVESS